MVVTTRFLHLGLILYSLKFGWKRDEPYLYLRILNLSAILLYHILRWTVLAGNVKRLSKFTNSSLFWNSSIFNWLDWFWRSVLKIHYYATFYFYLNQYIRNKIYLSLGLNWHLILTRSKLKKTIKISDKLCESLINTNSFFYF